MIGGMSWESTQVYYQLMNQKVKEELGGFHSCKCILDSVDFAEIKKLQFDGDWETLDKLMAQSAANLEKAGAELLIICTNTMHLSVPEIERAVDIPVLHIAKATGEEIQKSGLSKVLLLGTRFTMEKDLYHSYLKENYGIEIMIPEEDDRELVHQIIYQELVQGKITDSSRVEFQRIINKGQKQGAQGVILGCTEIPLLIKPHDVEIPVFDTTAIHSTYAVKTAIN